MIFARIYINLYKYGNAIVVAGHFMSNIRTTFDF